jgi:hypothetical protein
MVTVERLELSLLLEGTCSHMHMLIIAYDRYMSLKHPFMFNNFHVSIQHLRSKRYGLRRHSFKLGFAWFGSCLVWIPLFIAGYKQHNQTCFIEINSLIILAHSVFVYFLPFLLILILYIISFYYLHKTIGSFKATSQSSYSNKLVKSEVHVLKRLVFITTSFLICW